MGRTGRRRFWPRADAGYRQAPDRLRHGVMELALRHPGDAFRVVYALQIDDDI